mgnify:CR=1 FL=1
MGFRSADREAGWFASYRCAGGDRHQSLGMGARNRNELDAAIICMGQQKRRCLACDLDRGTARGCRRKVAFHIPYAAMLSGGETGKGGCYEERPLAYPMTHPVPELGACT